MGKLLFAALLTWAFCAAAPAQVIQTIAGNALNDNQAATATTLVHPWGIAIDAQGNTYVADTGTFVVRRLDPRTGRVTIVAGSGRLEESSFPIPGTAAALDYPALMAIDGAGNVYITEPNRSRVRKLAPDGTLTIVAGTGECRYPDQDNVPATTVGLCNVFAIVSDRAGNLFLGVENTVYRVDAATGRLRRYAGDERNESGFRGDGGPALSALLNNVRGLAIDGQGNLYIADRGNNRIRRVDADTGSIRTVAGTGVYGFGGDGGAATAAQFASPFGITLDASGNLLIADSDNSRVRRVDARTGVITTIAGNGESSVPRENVPATSTSIGYPVALAIEADGSLLISDYYGHRVRRVQASSNLVSTAIGSSSVGDNGPALSGVLVAPMAVAVDSAGNVYIADEQQNRVRKIDAATGRITTVAGNGTYGFSGDGGLATNAQLASPRSVAVNARGEIFIADTANERVRRVDTSGNITTYAGGGAATTDGGGATAARLFWPIGLAVDTAGTLYIGSGVDSNPRIRAVSPAGSISTIAASTTFVAPIGLAMDNTGNLLIADAGTCDIRRVNLSNGTVSSVAGTAGQCDTTGDGSPATQARFSAPVAVAADSSGNVYVAEQYGPVIRRFTAGGNITTVAGQRYFSGFGGDGDLATRAQLNEPRGLAVDRSGNLIIADTNNSRVRRVTFNQQPVPLLSVNPPSLTFNALAGSQPGPQSLVIANVFAGDMPWNATVATSSGGNWLSILPQSGNASPSAQATVAVNTSGLQPGTYRGTITVTAAGASGSPATVPVTLTVGESAVAKPGVSAQFLQFFAIQGDPSPTPQALAITSTSSGTLNWTASTTTSDGGNWLAVSSASGTAPSTLSVSVTPGSLAPGLYLGIVTIRNTASAETFAVAVALTVSAPTAVLVTSHSSVVFTAVQGASALAPQTLSILNTGRGAMTWSIQSILPAGGSWLTVSPTTGTANAGTNGSPVSVSVNPSGLSPGAYGAVLLISSPAANNSPSIVTVLMNVRAQGTAPVAVVEPAGLVFVAASGSAAQQQTINVSSSGGTAMRFTIAARTPDGSAWLSVNPGNGQVPASGAAIPVTVSAAPGQLAAGVREGTLTITPESGSPVDIAVRLVLTPGTGPSGLPIHAACAATRQVVTPQGRITNNFSLPISWPATLVARVTDDCGQAVANATVTAAFSTESGSVVLNNLRNGQYAGTWVPQRQAASATVNLRALAPPLTEGTLRLDGALRTDNLVPVVPANAAVNAASYAKLTADGPAAPLAAGSIFSLFGSNYGSATTGASAVPLPRSLSDVQVKIGGLDAPLFFVSPGQINAQVPWELAGRTSTSIAVSVRGAVSGTETLTLAPQHPGIFSMSASGAGQGAILDANFRLVDAANPVAAGDTVQIFATGLGATTPTLASGEAAPTDRLLRVNASVQARIGNVDAPVDFAGLAPGFVGLYQVNVRVPAGVSGEVPVVLIVGGVQSNAVTMRVR